MAKHQGFADDRKEHTVPKPQWSALLKLLDKHLDKAAIELREGGRELSPEEHNAFYHAIFDKVRAEVASRDDIPNAVMEEPTKTLTLTFYGRWNEPVCLGCLDFHDKNDIIHVEVHAKEDEPDGVTKDDLICRICEVVYRGIHIQNESKKEIGVLLSKFDWMGTTTMCNLVDSILYIGYGPAATASSGEKDRSEGERDIYKEKYEVTWDPKALRPGALSVQGYNDDYAHKLMVLKGWDQEDWDLCMAF
ncbi:hypothetical protein F4781DRAFT_406526 [Annulohypoxylon bovei var. microspora]|nr:hypothetical protein F4781DRAFT_406526 [Annulohypoxylon bovei var. microspora]